MKKFNLFIIAMFGVLCFGVVSAFAQSVVSGGPGGSYNKTCKDIKTTDNVTITALCKEKTGILGDLGGIVYSSTKLSNYFTCDGDIFNDDGKLCCTRNLKTARFQAAKTAFDEVTENLTDGLPIFDDDPDKEIQGWIRLYYINGSGAANYPNNITKNSPGVYSTVANFIKGASDLHTRFVNSAFQKVYQRGATEQEITEWTKQLRAGMSFSTIVKLLQKKKDGEAVNNGSLPSK